MRRDVSRYVSSARLLCLLVPLAAILSFQALIQVRNQYRDYRDIRKATVLAWLDFTNSRASVMESKSGWCGIDSIGPLDELDDNLFKGTDIGEVGIFRDTCKAGAKNVFIIRKFQGITGMESFLFRAPDATFYSARSVLKVVSKDLGLPLKESPKENFEQISVQMFGQAIQIPGVPVLKFDPMLFCLIVAAWITVLLAVIKSRLLVIVGDDAGGKGEPWLVMDANQKVERAVAMLWTGSLLLAPFIAAIAAFGVTTDYFYNMDFWYRSHWKSVITFLVITINLVISLGVSRSISTLLRKIREKRIMASEPNNGSLN